MMTSFSKQDLIEFYKLEFGKDWRYAQMLNLIPVKKENKLSFFERVMLRFEIIGCVKASSELKRLGHAKHAKVLDDRRIEIINML